MEPSPPTGPPIVDVFVRGWPVTQGSIGHANGNSYNDHWDELMAWRGRIEKVVRAAAAPVFPRRHPVVVEATFWIPKPSSTAARYLLPATGNDIDKMLRAVLDGVASTKSTVQKGAKKGERRVRGAGLIPNDSQVVCAPIDSRYAPTPEEAGVRIAVWLVDRDLEKAGWVPKASWSYERA